MDSNSLIKRYQSGKRDFSWVDLQNADLSKAELPNINLYHANLAGANLTGTNLAEANLFKANLAGADLVNAQLAGANLRKADLRMARFVPDQIQSADCRGAQFSEEFSYLAAARTEDETEDTPAESATLEASLSPEDRPPLIPPEVNSATSSWARSFHSPDLPSHRLTASTEDTPTPHPPPSARDQQELAISLATLGFGYACYGLILGDAHSPGRMGLLVWMSLLLGLWQEDLVWYVPIAGAVAVLLGVGVSLGVLIFVGPVIVALLISFGIYGNILSWSVGKSVRTALWFGGLMLVQMHVATWLFDGSDAYSGGGIVLNLASFQVALLMIVGILAVGRGAIAYIQLNDGHYPRKTQWLYVGGSAAVGLAVGMMLGWQ